MAAVTGEDKMVLDDRPLCVVLDEAGEFGLMQLVENEPAGERPAILVKVFSTIIAHLNDIGREVREKHRHDKEAAGMIPLILLAVKEARSAASPSGAEAAELALLKLEEEWRKREVRKEYTRYAEVEVLFDLLQQLQVPETRATPLIETRRALILAILAAWARFGSDDQAQLYWERLFSLPLCHPKSNDAVSLYYGNDGKFLTDIIRGATDSTISIVRLNRAIGSLLGPVQEIVKKFPILSPAFGYSCWWGQGGQKHRDEVARVLAIARTRNLGMERTAMEIPILAALGETSPAAYEAMAAEAKLVAAQDAAGRKLLERVRSARDDQGSRKISVNSDGAKVEFPTRSTIVLFIVWDEEKEHLVGLPNPNEAVFHRWVEAAKVEATAWRKEFPTYRVIVKMFTRPQYRENAGKLVLFREEKVS